MPRSPLTVRHRRVAAALAVLALFPTALTACSSSDGPDETVAAFLAGWRNGNLDQVGFVGADGASFPAQQVVEQIRSLSGELARTPPRLRAQGEPEVTGDVATTAVEIEWPLPGGVRWTYSSAVRLTQRKGKGWRVVWEPAIVQSQLTAGDRLALRRLPAKRSGVLDGAGRPLVTPRPVVVVGVTPQDITDLPELTADLTAAFKKIDVDVDMKDLKSRVEKADEGAFVELVTLRETDYNKIRDVVRPLGGTVFRKESRDLAPTREFARALLGTVGPATKDDIAAKPDTLVAGDVVGHGGLQQQYDTQLRGTIGQSVVIAQEAPDGTITDTEVFRSEPRAGTAVKTTLDVATQNAADKALADETRRSALVAVRIRDSAVLAVANGPDGGDANLALTAQVPPGSTFKMVSALGLLQRKAVTLDGTVDCPKTSKVAGREFRNAHEMALGKVPFRTIFAKSCNTAFAGLAPKLGAGGLAETAAQVGLGTPWDLGVETFSGKVSTGGTPVEQAAAAFGQGTTVVSPLAMAGATAAVARGRFQQPQLLLDPAPAPAPAGPELPADAVEPLREMMREVVTKGTGTVLRDVPGKPVYGKTGTAEFNNTKDTHAWLVGWQGDIAFAAFVEKGGEGAETAGPIVEAFLRNLASA